MEASFLKHGEQVTRLRVLLQLYCGGGFHDGNTRRLQFHKWQLSSSCALASLRFVLNLISFRAMVPTGIIA